MGQDKKFFCTLNPLSIMQYWICGGRPIFSCLPNSWGCLPPVFMPFLSTIKSTFLCSSLSPYRNKELDSTLDVCWQLSNRTTLPFPSAPHLGRLLRKAKYSLLCLSQKVQTLQVLASHVMFRATWKPSLISPENLIMWVINLFIPFWCICAIISLNFQTKF